MITSSCNKEPNVTVNISVLKVDNDHIDYYVELDILPSKIYPQEVGMKWGTSSDLTGNGTHVSSTNHYSYYSSEVPDVEFGTLYYFQAYAIVEDKEYLSIQKTIKVESGWQELASSPSEEIQELALTPSGKIHIVGNLGHHFFSEDEGMTWNQVVHVNTDYLREVKFINEDVAFLRAANLFRKSIDGGLSWIDIDIPTIGINGVCFYDEEQLHYAYKDTIYSSFDSGQNWIAAPTGLPASSSMTDIYFISSLIGYSINFSGYLLKTSDGGLSWNIHHNMSWGAGREVYFINEQVGFLGMSAVVFMTSDGGLTWNGVCGSNSDYINAIHFLTENVGIAAGGERIYKTWDGGLTWEEGYFPDYGLGIFDIELFDIYKGYAIQNDGVVLRYQH